MKLKVPELGNKVVEFPDELAAEVNMVVRRNGYKDVVSSGFSEETLPEINGKKLIDSEMADIIKKETGVDCRKPYWDIKVIDSSGSAVNEVIEDEN